MSIIGYTKAKVDELLAALDTRVDTLEASPGGAVSSVNSKTGAVVLTASDVGADASGAATTAQAAAIAAAATDATSKANSVNVLTLGLKGDVVTVTDAAITSGSAVLSRSGGSFTSADVGKRVQVIGAGAAWNVRGAWASSTAYAVGDLVTFGGNNYVSQAAFTSGSTFTTNSWALMPSQSKTLLATISSVSGGNATLDTTASTTVSGATCTYGTDDSAAINAAGAGDFYFPSNRTYFVADWFVPSNTDIRFGAGVVFKVPYFSTTDVAPIRLKTSSSSSTSYISNIHLHGTFVFDATELTPNDAATQPRGIHILNCSDWSIERAIGIGIPGTTGNVIQTGANGAVVAPARRGRVGYVENTNVRGLGSSCVQHTGGNNIAYGSLVTDSGVAARFELDSNALVADNCTVELAYNSGTGLFPNAAVFFKPHGHTLRNVRVASVLAEGTADGVAASYTSGGSISDCSVDRMRVTGGGQAITLTTTNLSLPGVTIRNAVVDSAGSVTLNRNNPTLPSVGFVMAPGMSFYACRSLNSVRNGFQDISQSSVATGTTIRLYDCEATGSTWNGLQADKTEKVQVFGGKLSTNGLYAVQTSSGVTVELRGTDTRSNTTGISTGAGTVNVIDEIAGAGAAAAAAAQAFAIDRANHTGTQLSTTVSDFTEAVQDAVAGLLVAGSNVTLTYNDAANTLTVASSGGGGSTTWGDRSRTLTMRTGAIAESMPRIGYTVAYQATASGQMQLMSIPLIAGQTVSTITFTAGTTAAGSPTNQWFALYSPAGALLGVTNDDTTTAWAGGAEKTLTLASPYSVTTDGLYYVACMVAATTPPTLWGASMANTTYTARTPVLGARDSTHTGLTNPASAPTTATLTASLSMLYAWVS